MVLLIDSLTQLARAYNASLPGSGKMLASGIDAQAVHKVKRLFGAARNLDSVGSLTLIACVRSDTGARMDEHLLEELRAAANAEIHLSQEAAQHRIFPALDIHKSGTAHTDKLLSAQDEERLTAARSSLPASPVEALQGTLKLLSATKSTHELLDKVAQSGD